MIKLENVKKTYPDFSIALDLTIKKGELVSILGPSGSGKSTSLRLIAGFETPDTGRILIDGKDVTHMNPAERKIGFVFQDYTLFPHMSVFENIAYGLKIRKKAKEDIESVVARNLDLVGLPGYQRRSIQTLSGGEQQRTAIARALAVGPVLLMLDEPFSSIDTILRKELRQEIIRLQKALGITVVFVTHNQEEALAISDRVVVLRSGSIVQAGTPQELYTRPTDRFVAAMVGVANFLPARVTEHRDGHLFVDGFQRFKVTVEPDRSFQVAAGDSVTLLIRPNQLRVVDIREREEVENVFELEVTSRQYFGHYFEYLCETHGNRLTLFDVRFYKVGARLTAAFEPDAAVLLAD
jgi:ABC-type Fe3+/spermidine/putrescine transport system ATPase subunit